MQAVILVGGEGTRLRPLTYDTPKQLLRIAGVTMIERVVASLKVHGITSVVLSMGYMPDRFVAAFPDFEVGGLPLSYAVESEPLDTAGAIRFAALHAGVSDTFVAVNGDVLTDLDLTALVAFHRARAALTTLSLHPVDDPSRFGVVTTDETGRVLGFIEKPAREDAPTNEINAGTYVMEPSVLDRIAATGRESIERVTFPQLVAEGSLFALSDSSYWLDTGTPASFLAAHEDLLTGGRRAPSLVLSEGSWIHPDAVIDPTATLRCSSIDAGCRVGPGVTLSHVVMLEGAAIEHDAVVQDSIIGLRTVIGANARLGATCVIGSDQRIAEGTALSGDVRVGGPS